MLGNTANLRKAAAARTAEAAARAENALVAMIKEGEPVTFRGLAAKSGSPWTSSTATTASASASSTTARLAPNREPSENQARKDQPSSVVRTLTAQLADLKRRHREETAALRQALEQAHGENLALRRRLAAANLASPSQTRTRRP